MLGWFAVIWASWYLWAAASEVVDDTADEDFFRPQGRAEQLLSEKKSLLKAIKEIEFDRQMRKMSDRDAEELSRHYRARAIEVIKRLETQRESLSTDVEIDREVQARLEVERISSKAREAQTQQQNVAGQQAKNKAMGDSE